MAIMTLAQARENFLAAMETLRSSKVRSALTVLGIVIGVSSVISMAAIIQGLNKFVQDRVERLGSRTYFISRFPFGTDPSRLPERIRARPLYQRLRSGARAAGRRAGRGHQRIALSELGRPRENRAHQ